jgi:predicted transcriptional regulator
MNLLKKVNLLKAMYMSKAFEKELFNYFNQLTEAEKKSVLQMLKTFVTGRKKESTRISIEQYNKELDEAEAAFERGEYVTHEEVLKQMKKW